MRHDISVLIDRFEVQFILLSPWTINLCADLKTALGERDDNSQFKEYFTVLKQRLEVTGAVLLKEVNNPLSPNLFRDK
jgi:hypothetical protein